MFPITIAPSPTNSRSNFWEIRIPIGRRKFMPINSLMEQCGMESFSFSIQGIGDDSVMVVHHHVSEDSHWVALGQVIERLKLYGDI